MNGPQNVACTGMHTERGYRRSFVRTMWRVECLETRLGQAWGWRQKG